MNSLHRPFPPFVLSALAVAWAMLSSAIAGRTADTTFNAAETWSVTLNYRNFADGYTGTRTFSGKVTGKVTVRNGRYTLVNKAGVQLGGIDSDLVTRTIVQSGANYSISGGYVFAPAYGASAHGILFLGAFIVRVPLVDGEVPAFYDFDTYSGYGPPSAITGGGYMKGFSLTATVTSTLSLTAGNTPAPGDSPFAGAAGSYAGILHDPGDVRPESSGFLTAKVTATGSFSANLTSGTGSAGFSGSFDPIGKATNQILIGTETLVAELALDLASGDQLNGRISGPGWTATLETDRAVFDTRNNPAVDLAHRYTLLIPGGVNPATEPHGDGFASVTVNPAGQISLKGFLADGTPITQRTALSKDGLWPLYLQLLGGQGSVVGWLKVDPSAGNAIDGRLHWFKKPGVKSAYYPQGFALESMVQGSVWMGFIPGGGAGSDPETSAATLTFTGGNLPEALNYPVTFSEQGKLLHAGADKLVFKLKPATGLFSGSVRFAAGGAGIRFRGAVLPQQGYGSGFFLGSNESGRIVIAE